MLHHWFAVARLSLLEPCVQGNGQISSILPVSGMYNREMLLKTLPSIKGFEAQYTRSVQGVKVRFTPRLHANDIVRYTGISKLETGLLTIQRAIHLRRQLSTEISSLNRVAAFTCTICDASFSRQNDLKGDQTRYHGIQAGRIRTLCFASHAPTGVPTCALCKSHFTTWRAIKTRVEWICDPPQELDSVETFKQRQREFRQTTLCVVCEGAAACTLYYVNKTPHQDDKCKMKAPKET